MNADPSSSPVASPPRPSSERGRGYVRSRTASLWIGVAVALVALVILVVFLMQNTEPVEVTFFGARGSAPLALVCLISGLAVGSVVLAVGALRIGQLRRRVKHDRRS